MARRIEFEKAALRDLQEIPLGERASILTALERFAETGDGDVRKLQGRKQRWALRWGNWRAIYVAEGPVLRVLRVMDRKEAYRPR